MVALSVPVNLPRFVLGYEGSLWQSAFHLIHPKVAPFNANNTPVNDDAYENSLDEAQIFDYSTPFHEVPLVDAFSGREYGLKIGAGFNFLPECPAPLTCWNPCEDDCQDLDSPTKPKDAECNTPAIREITPVEIVFTAPECSTFGHEAADYRGRAERGLRAGRSTMIEKMLIQGGCSANPFLSQPVVTSGVVILAGGIAQSLQCGIAKLDAALSGCSPHTAGMIHVPTSVITELNNDYVNSEFFDYGDGMGPRKIFRTGLGSIVVSGSGYSSGIGPGGALPTIGTREHWIYGTSMVNLVWDKIRILPDDLEDAIIRRRNRVQYRAEQTVAAFYDPCCLFAIKINLC